MNAKAFQARHKRKPAKNEHCLQRAIVNWCDGLGGGLVKGRFFAIPNGGARDIITASKLKAEGVRAGAPDLVFYRVKDVLWVEVKNGTSGRISPAQVELHQRLKDNAHSVAVVRSLAEAIETIKKFYQ